MTYKTVWVTLFLLIVCVLAAGVYLNTVFSDSIKNQQTCTALKKEVEDGKINVVKKLMTELKISSNQQDCIQQALKQTSSTGLRHHFSLFCVRIY